MMKRTNPKIKNLIVSAPVDCPKNKLSNATTHTSVERRPKIVAEMLFVQEQADPLAQDDDSKYRQQDDLLRLVSRILNAKKEMAPYLLITDTKPLPSQYLIHEVHQLILHHFLNPAFIEYPWHNQADN